MKDIQNKKTILRKKIAEAKAKFSSEELQLMSDEVWGVFELTGVFQDAKKIFIYNSLPDEVQTTLFIEKWAKEKEFYLPVVSNQELVFRRYDESVKFEKSDYGIFEPEGDNYQKYSEVDLIVVPAMAFDRRSNRLGRGKGYYDRFLPKLKSSVKVGVCFDFQLLDEIPYNENDIQMDYIISENDLIWK